MSERKQGKNYYNDRVLPNLYLIEAWARQGLNNTQIADNLRVNPKTIYAWQNKYPEFREALRANKQITDTNVENAMYKRAIGYETTEVTKELRAVLDDDGNTVYKKVGKRMVRVEEEVIVKTVTKHIAGDTGAQLNWLKNRKPEMWQDKKDVHIDANKLEQYFVQSEQQTKDSNSNKDDSK